MHLSLIPNLISWSESNYFEPFYISRQCPGDSSVVEPPDPIPNSEVKSDSADDSAGATLRENTSSPGYCFEMFFIDSGYLFKLT